MQTPGPRGLSSLRHGVAVLQAFGSVSPVLGVTEISEITGLHKSVVSRVLALLEEHRFVERDPLSRKFALGMGLVGLTGSVLAELDVRRVSRPFLRDLRDRTGETAALMVWTGSAAVCVEQESSSRDIKHTTPIGTHFNTSWSASVQAFLSLLPDEAVRRDLVSGQFELGSGSPDDLLAALGRGREHGVFVNNRRTASDVVGVAALVYDYRASAVGAILVAAPAYRHGDEGIALLADAVRGTARAVGGQLASSAAGEEAR